MSLDVVKSNSKRSKQLLKSLHILGVITLLTAWTPTVKQIFNYLICSKTTSITVHKVVWEKPLVRVYFSQVNSTKSYSQNLSYLKITSQEHFELLEKEIKKKLDKGFYQKNKPQEIYLQRIFPFKNLIYCCLSSLLYVLIVSLVKESVFHKIRLTGKRIAEKITI